MKLIFKRDEAIEALDLRPTARKGAYILKFKHPDIKFNSGRRNRYAQANAMATNVLKNRKWIGETYKHHEVSIACQQWVDEHPDAVTLAVIEKGFLEVFDRFTDEQLLKLSLHMSGDAFDVQPVEENEAAIKADIRALPHLDTFLEKEGGLIRWHAQFRNDPEDKVEPVKDDLFVFQTPISVA